MSEAAHIRSGKLIRARALLRRARRDQRGATALEFALLAMPFFLFMFGIMGIGLQFFTTNALEHGVESAARKIRTGQAQKANKKLSEFRQMVCDAAGTYIDCDSSLVVHVQSATSWSGIVPKSCLTNNALTAASGNQSSALTTASGTAEAVVLVTVCYEWKLAQSLRFLAMSNMPNGSALIQAAATFRTEPYQ